MHHTAVAGDAATWSVTHGVPKARSDALVTSSRALGAHERLDRRPVLARQQRQVLYLLNQGLTYCEVADHLTLAEKTVRRYASASRMSRTDSRMSGSSSATSTVVVMVCPSWPWEAVSPREGWPCGAPDADPRATWTSVRKRCLRRVSFMPTRR